MLTVRHKAFHRELQFQALKLRNHCDILEVWALKTDFHILFAWMHGDERSDNISMTSVYHISQQNASALHFHGRQRTKCLLRAL